MVVLIELMAFIEFMFFIEFMVFIMFIVKTFIYQIITLHLLISNDVNFFLRFPYFMIKILQKKIIFLYIILDFYFHLLIIVPDY